MPPPRLRNVNASRIGRLTTDAFSVQRERRNVPHVPPLLLMATGPTPEFVKARALEVRPRGEKEDFVWDGAWAVGL